MGVVSRPSNTVLDDSRVKPDPSDSDNYVDKLLRNADPLPPVTWSNWHKQVRWFNLSVIVITPLAALYGAATTRLDVRTFYFCVFYYVFNMIGTCLLPVRLLSPNLVGGSKESPLVCASLCTILSHRNVPFSGYHRLWSHRAYNASKPLEYFLAVAGGGSVQGAIWWWARGHRSHHR